MTLREHTWEFTVNAVSWIVAIAAIGLVIGLVAYDAFRTRRKGTRP